MGAAYVDTSVLVAMTFHERGAAALSRKLARFEPLIASNLLEAELRSACAREGLREDPVALRAVSWILPERPLTQESRRVLEAGYLRGGDCWHLACALYAAEQPESITFLTLDAPQRVVARRLGFRT